MSARESGPEPALSEYARLCRHNWKLVAGLVVAAAAVAGALSLAQTELYRATGDIRFGKASALEAGVAVARSKRFERSASRDLGFQADVTVAAADSSTIRFTAEGENPRKVARVADSYARALARSLSDGAKVVSRAEVPRAPSRPTTVRNVALGAVLGLALSFGVILARSKS